MVWPLAPRLALYTTLSLSGVRSPITCTPAAGIMLLPGKVLSCCTVEARTVWCTSVPPWAGLADSDACRYYLLIGLTVAPLLAVGNAYGAGLTDWNMASLYTKVSAAREHCTCRVLSPPCE